MAMAPVCARDVVVASEPLADADGDRLLADVEMSESRHLGAEIELIDLLFEQSNLQHLAIKMNPALVLGNSGALRWFRFSLFRLSHRYIHNWSDGVLLFSETPPLHHSITPSFYPRHSRQGFKQNGKIFFCQSHA